MFLFVGIYSIEPDKNVFASVVDVILAYLFCHKQWLHFVLSLAAQCIVIGPVCVFAMGGRCV